MGAKCHDAKVTTMVLKVDLECHKCYKKVKKVLCKFPQIRNQVYDEKANTVTITVVCCSPEKIAEKLCCKGGGSIKSIDIKEPPPPKPAAPVPDKPKQTEKPKSKETETPKPAPMKPKEGESLKPAQEKPKEDKPKPAAEKPKEDKPKSAPTPEKPKEDKPKSAPAPEKPKEAAPKPAPTPTPKQPGPQAPAPIPVMPSYPALPPGQPAPCCGPCYDGRFGGPCYSGYGIPAPPAYYEYYGRPIYDSWGYGGAPYRVCHPSRCDYFSEENPQACTIM